MTEILENVKVFARGRRRRLRGRQQQGCDITSKTAELKMGVIYVKPVKFWRINQQIHETIYEYPNILFFFFFFFLNSEIESNNLTV